MTKNEEDMQAGGGPLKISRSKNQSVEYKGKMGSRRTCQVAGALKGIMRNHLEQKGKKREIA